ncbi:hypothetical protein [Paenibacillus campinasensis]|nr:hypothetical protein [Paenibacillus campinasensis]
MAEITTFLMHVEYYVKTKVDLGIITELGEEAYERFLTKAAIEISRSTSPKQVYGLGRDDVREIVHDILSDISQRKWICPQRERMFSYLNNAGEPIYVFARYKKDATNIARSAMNVSPRYWGSFKTLRKAVEVNESGKVVLDNGEERDIESPINFVNLYGHGRNYDE